MKNQSSIRQSILRKLEPRAKALYLQMPQYAKPVTAKKPKRIARNTKKRAQQGRIYRARVKVWLELPENVICRVTVALGKMPLKSKEVHHKHGRRGELLLCEKYWIPVSNCGHQWIHSNPQKARELGLLAPLGQWNQMPKE